MREARVVWTDGGGMTRFTQAGWRVVDAFGRDHAFFPVGPAGLTIYTKELWQVEEEAMEVRNALNARGARRERETRRVRG